MGTEWSVGHRRALPGRGREGSWGLCCYLQEFVCPHSRLQGVLALSCRGERQPSITQEAQHPLQTPRLLLPELAWTDMDVGAGEGVVDWVLVIL